MKRILLSLLSVLSVLSVPAEEPRGELVESMPPASQLLAAARAQLPSYPVVMTGTLQERAANGFVKKRAVEIELDWHAAPPRAEYRISDGKNERFQTLEIQWLSDGPGFQCLENGVLVSNFNPHAEIQNLGVTWSDLSFSFLWSEDAETEEIKKRFGKDKYKLSIPRPGGHTLFLWMEKETGRMTKAEEVDADGVRQKVIAVKSVKEFNGLWMAKDIDIVRPKEKRYTSLRINRIEAGN